MRPSAAPVLVRRSCHRPPLEARASTPKSRMQDHESGFERVLSVLCHADSKPGLRLLRRSVRFLFVQRRKKSKGQFGNSAAIRRCGSRERRRSGRPGDRDATLPIAHRARRRRIIDGDEFFFSSASSVRVSIANPPRVFPGDTDDLTDESDRARIVAHALARETGWFSVVCPSSRHRRMIIGSAVDRKLLAKSVRNRQRDRVRLRVREWVRNAGEHSREA